MSRHWPPGARIFGLYPLSYPGKLWHRLPIHTSANTPDALDINLFLKNGLDLLFVCDMREGSRRVFVAALAISDSLKNSARRALWISLTNRFRPLGLGGKRFPFLFAFKLLSDIQRRHFKMTQELTLALAALQGVMKDHGILDFEREYRGKIEEMRRGKLGQEIGQDMQVFDQRLRDLEKQLQ